MYKTILACYIASLSQAVSLKATQEASDMDIWLTMLEPLLPDGPKPTVSSLGEQEAAFDIEMIEPVFEMYMYNDGNGTSLM